MTTTPFGETIDDETLFSRMTAGDREAFRLLVRRYQGLVTRVACRLLNGDGDTAEDIGQETFLRLYRHAGEYQIRGQFRAYLLTITRNLCRDYLRRQHPTESLDGLSEQVSTAVSSEERAERQEQSEIVRQAIAQLSEEHRAVLVLSHYEGFSYQEIATILGCPPGTVASRRHHALAVLRRHLQTYWEETRP